MVPNFPVEAWSDYGTLLVFVVLLSIVLTIFARTQAKYMKGNQTFVEEVMKQNQEREARAEKREAKLFNHIKIQDESQSKIVDTLRELKSEMERLGDRIRNNVEE